MDASFLASEQALREFGAPFHLAQALLDHASWLQRHGRDDEGQAALAEARELLTALDARTWLEQVGAAPAGAVLSG